MEPREKTIQEIIQDINKEDTSFNNDSATEADLPKKYPNQLKTPHSNNITVEEWNLNYKLLKHITAEAKSLVIYTKALAQNIIDSLHATDLENYVPFSIFDAEMDKERQQRMDADAQLNDKKQNKIQVVELNSASGTLTDEQYRILMLDDNNYIKFDGRIYKFTSHGVNQRWYTAIVNTNDNKTQYRLIVNSDKTYSHTYYNLQEKALVTNFNNADNTHYPSALAVKNELDNKQNKVQYVNLSGESGTLTQEQIDILKASYLNVPTTTQRVFTCFFKNGNKRTYEGWVSGQLEKRYISVDLDTGEWTTANVFIQEKALVTVINASSDDTHYPSAKAVYDTCVIKSISVNGTSGTLTTEQLNLLLANDMNYIIRANREYRLIYKDADQIYYAVYVPGESLLHIKITISTLAWTWVGYTLQSKITMNPTESATASAEKIKVDGVVYDLTNGGYIPSYVTQHITNEITTVEGMRALYGPNTNWQKLTDSGDLPVQWKRIAD